MRHLSRDVHLSLSGHDRNALVTTG